MTGVDVKQTFQISVLTSLWTQVRTPRLEERAAILSERRYVSRAVRSGSGFPNQKVVSSPRPLGPARHAEVSIFRARKPVELVGLRRIALGGDDVAKSAQAVGLLGSKTQFLRNRVAFVC